MALLNPSRKRLHFQRQLSAGNDPLQQQQPPQLQFQHRTLREEIAERRSLKQTQWTNALERSSSELVHRLVPHAFGVAMGLQFHGIFTKAEVDDYKRRMISYGGSMRAVEDLLGMIKSKKNAWFEPLLNVLADLHLTDVAAQLRANADEAVANSEQQG